MISIEGSQISQFDILVGKIKTPISENQRTNIPIVIEFNEGIDPFPNEQFLFIIDTEQVLCTSKIDDTHYTITRDPFNKGLKLGTHVVNEDVYFIPIGSALLKGTMSSDSLIDNDSLRYVDEILFSSLGKHSVIDIFDGAYDDYFGTTVSVSGDEVKVTIKPGFLFVSSSTGVKKSLIISDNEVSRQKNYVTFSNDYLEENRTVYVYIKNDATFSYSSDPSPSNVHIDSESNKYVLCSVSFNEDSPTNPIIEDLRPDILKESINKEFYIDSSRLIGELPVTVIKDGSIEKVKLNDSYTKNWDNAYSWGDHSEENYLKEESPAGSITQQLITHWNDSFSWGDHSKAGYLIDPYTEETEEGQSLVRTDEGYTWKHVFDYTNGTITRNGNGIITGFSSQEKTMTFTRDENGNLATISDGKRTWTFTRNNDMQITSWEVTKN